MKAQIRRSKPTSAGRRHYTYVSYQGLAKNVKKKSLLVPKPEHRVEITMVGLLLGIKVVVISVKLG